jgi:DNA polymerase-1
MYLVDAPGLFFQSFHAIPEMTSPSGLPTNALYGLTRDLLYLRGLKPDYLICAFDRAEPTFRNAIHPDYKAHRPPMPDDLQLQLPLMDQLLQAMRIPVLSVAGFEADDLLATVATAAEQRGLEVLLCTSDKDCRQLIDDHVQLFNLRKRQVFGKKELLAEWGITPEQVVDLQALVGDPVDNVPGVPGIGVKTAAMLLQKYGTLDQLLAQVDQVPGKKGEALKASAEIVRKSRQLVRLERHVDLEMDWEGWKLRDWDAPRLLALFRDWGFRSFAEQVRAASKGLVAADADDTGPATPARRPVQRQLFASDDDDSVETDGQPAALPAASLATFHDWKSTYHLVNTENKLEPFVAELARQERIALDLETTSLQPLRAELVGLAFCWKAGEAWYLPVRGPESEAVLPLAETLAKLRPVLEDPRVAKINQNIKYDLLVLRQQGLHLAGVAGDPMLADYLLHAGERSHSLNDLAARYLDYRPIPITDLIGKGKNQVGMDQVPTARVADYAGEDAEVAWRLCAAIEPRLADQGLRRLYDDLEIPLIEVLAELEFNGVRLDVPLLQRLSVEMAQQLAEIEREIYELAGRPFNIASPKQLREVLFGELKLPRQRRTGITGEASTNQDSLERLAALGHPLPRRILEHRQIAKLKGTYVDALPGLINPATGRIHASFNQTVAATGRLSSSDPNLQNIPVRTEQGRQIRQAFVPEEGWQLLTADYSQIELRLLAHFSGDAALRAAFAQDRDIHAAVAAQTFGVGEAEVTGDMRRVAKTINFGIVYGMSAFGLAQRLGITKEDAARYIDAYFARCPAVLEYQSRLLADCKRQGWVGTILGRRRQIAPAGIRARSSYQQRNQSEREAINMQIQGSAADLMKLAMLRVWRRLGDEHCRARMLLTVHDELVFEVPPDELEEVAALVGEEMTTPLEKELALEVPLKVDLAAGPNWLDVQELAEVRA